MLSTLPVLTPALAPIERALLRMRARRGPSAAQGLVPGLVVPPGRYDGWRPAAELLSGGPMLAELLAAARQRWSASPHAAAALAWRSYTYWLTMLVGLGWANARRVPLVHPDDVLVQIEPDEAPLRLGLRRVRLAVLPDDPHTEDPRVDTLVCDSETELLALLRYTLRDTHLDPLAARLRSEVRLGERALLGSVASGAAYAVVRGYASPSDEDVTATARQLLDALGLADLVTLVPGPAGPEVRRHTCCLAFTLPEPKICSGCCLRTAD